MQMLHYVLRAAHPVIPPRISPVMLLTFPQTMHYQVLDAV